ncbi:asparagine--tRNA ligase [Candidatus Uhrbacteria bacterium]|nr:asparagine--tRNA ligase [Candidatus Uhrbacteria bacterium]
MTKTINQLLSVLDQTVSLSGWISNTRQSGKILFVQFRDGTGAVQIVYSKADVDEATWRALEGLEQESSVRVTGVVARDDRAPSGVELHGKTLEVIGASQDYPIANKEHGIDFLLDHRHLWLRSSKQWAILRVRDTIERATADFLHAQDFIRLDAPILTPNACEGTTELYETDHFGRPAYLSQSGQLYLEAGIFGHRRVYDFGPVFRAEKSKTRRHLNEFWMMDAEMAFCDWEGNMQMQEDLVVFIVARVLEERKAELALLERDVAALEKVQGPFPRIEHKQAIKTLRALGSDIRDDDDLGGDDETILTKEYDTPIFITKYPAKVKAFYMKRDEREIDLGSLTKKIEEYGLPMKQFEWYLDLRRYGSVPHSGFGFGLERLVTWICGLKHVRTAIPFPRTMNRLEP